MQLIPHKSGARAAFTLLEMLTVIVIIGLIITLALPAIKGMTRSNTLAAANRQLLDDLAHARQRAMIGRTTVHVVFVPTNILTMTFNTADPRDQKMGERLKTSQLTSYAMFAERSVGDQPGKANFRYLSDWKTLPDGVFIVPREFMDLPTTADWISFQLDSRPFGFTKLPFPTANGLTQRVPHIAFGPTGSLIIYDDTGNRLIEDEVIELARGSILYTRDANNVLIDFDARENPPNNSLDNFNRIRIDGLTGRAKLERPEIQ